MQAKTEKQKTKNERAEGETEASDNYYPYHRRDEKQLMKEVAAGLGFRSVAPAITQVFRHLHQEMERQNIGELALTDIKIAKPRRSRRGSR
jgi:hypothetical protein